MPTPIRENDAARMLTSPRCGQDSQCRRWLVAIGMRHLTHRDGGSGAKQLRELKA